MAPRGGTVSIYRNCVQCNNINNNRRTIVVYIEGKQKKKHPFELHISLDYTFDMKDSYEQLGSGRGFYIAFYPPPPLSHSLGLHFLLSFFGFTFFFLGLLFPLQL